MYMLAKFAKLQAKLTLTYNERLSVAISLNKWCPLVYQSLRNLLRVTSY